MAGKVVSVTSYDAPTGRATVDVFGQPLVGVLNVTGETLQPGWVVWVEQRGDALHADWVVTGIYNPPVRRPKARLFSTATQSIGTTPTRFDFNAAGGVVSYDTNDGTNTMTDQANSRIYCRLAGVYQYGGGGAFAAAGAGTRIFDIKLNNTLFIARVSTAETVAGDRLLTDQRAFATGDYIELFLTSTGGAMTFGSGSNELGMRLWMSIVP
jgi:hypothetical protein